MSTTPQMELGGGGLPSGSELEPWWAPTMDDDDTADHTHARYTLAT